MPILTTPKLSDVNPSLIAVKHVYVMTMSEIISVEEKRALFKKGTDKAKLVLKEGDRIRVTRCGGIKRTYTFSHFDGSWIVSKSGIDDLAASCIDVLNGKPVDFTI